MSAAAQGSRWDVSAQYEIGRFQEGDSEDDDEYEEDDDDQQMGDEEDREQ